MGKYVTKQQYRQRGETRGQYYKKHEHEYNIDWNLQTFLTKQEWTLHAGNCNPGIKYHKFNNIFFLIFSVDGEPENGYSNFNSGNPRYSLYT